MGLLGRMRSLGQSCVLIARVNMQNDALTEDQQITAVGNVLGPLFLKDPEQDVEVLPLLGQIAQASPDDLADSWAFADADVVRSSFTKMQTSIPNGTPTDAMVWEYRRLFVGPQAMPCPPWGSVYTDREKVVFGEAELTLFEWMKIQGIVPKDGHKEPVDHIGRMFELLAYLAQNRPELVNDFLQNHFLTWSSHYLDQLKECAKDPFYQGLADLAKSSLDGLQKQRELTVTYPRFYR